MTRIMYDAVSPNNVPSNATMVAGYIDGAYQSYNGLVARCPNAIHVPIAVHSTTNNGIVGDVEAGDMTPSNCVGWVVRRRAAGVDPTIYCSQSFWPQVRAAFKSQGVVEPHYWIAAYHTPPQATMIDGAVAHQYTDYQGLYDISVVADFWPGVDQNVPNPIPITRKDNYMFGIQCVGRGWAVIVGDSFIQIADKDQWFSFTRNHPGEWADVNTAQWDKLSA